MRWMGGGASTSSDFSRWLGIRDWVLDDGYRYWVLPCTCISFSTMRGSMDVNRIVAELDTEIAMLERARAVLAGAVSAAPAQKRITKKQGRRRKLSAEGRARIAAAQKVRWAKSRKDSGKLQVKSTKKIPAKSAKKSSRKENRKIPAKVATTTSAATA
jgi:hypothetical protein